METTLIVLIVIQLLSSWLAISCIFCLGISDYTAPKSKWGQFKDYLKYGPVAVAFWFISKLCEYIK